MSNYLTIVFENDFKTEYHKFVGKRLINDNQNHICNMLQSLN